MSKLIQLDRRSFLKSASLTAVGGSLASVTSIGSAAEVGSGGIKNGKFNFDEIYDRDGTGNRVKSLFNQPNSTGNEHLKNMNEDMK